MKRKAFVLLSGGLDSTTCLYKAISDFSPPPSESSLVPVDENARSHNPISWVEAISIDYGQRHKKETEYAARTCYRLGIEHTILAIGDILHGANTMLTNPNIEVPNISYSDIQGVSPTYVPFRNGTLLSVITAYAQKWVNEGRGDSVVADIGRSAVHEDMMVGRSIPSFADGSHYNLVIGHSVGSALPEQREAGIYFGAHSEDAANWAYPDCTPEFIGAMANAIYIGSYRAIRLYTPLQWLMKHEIVSLGTQLGVDFHYTWSCYKGEEYHCGTCPTCRSRREAFVKAKVYDPTFYESERQKFAPKVPRRTDLTNEDEIPF